MVTLGNTVASSGARWQPSSSSPSPSRAASRAVATCCSLLVLLVAGCEGASRDDESEGGIDSLGTSTSGATSSSTTALTTFDVGGDSATGPDDAATGSTTGKTCGEVTLVGVASTPYVGLVLDKSGSMLEKWIDGLETKTRWSSLHGTVELILREFVPALEFAIKLFPAADAGAVDGACSLAEDIEVPFGHSDPNTILSLIPPANAHVQGGTPAVGAVMAMYEYLGLLDTTNPRHAILVMDGRVSCGGDMATLSGVVAAARELGVPTHIIGIDVENAEDDPDLPEAMDALAQAGGTERYYPSNSALELHAAVSKIVGEITSCEFDLSPKPAFPLYVSMALAGQPIDRIDGVASCEAAAMTGRPDGWVYTNADNSAVEICGAACELFTSVGVADVHYGCEPPM